MNAEALLHDLTQRGVRLECRGDRLHVQATDGTLTDADRDALRQLKPHLLALLAGGEPGGEPAAPSTDSDFDAQELRAAWRGACRELAELLGWHELPFKSGHRVAPGAALWGRFLSSASVPDMELVLAELRKRVTALPGPDGEQGTRR